MGEPKAARVLCDVLAGLVYLHMHHICHRDLKPEVTTNTVESINQSINQSVDGSMSKGINRSSDR
jgi:serine/threonine protein kinase